MARPVDNKKVQELRSQAQALDVTLHVGKNGVTPETVEELRGQLQRRKLVKVRLLRAATHELGMDAQAQALAEATDATLVEVRGGTAVLWRP